MVFKNKGKQFKIVALSNSREDFFSFEIPNGYIIIFSGLDCRAVGEGVVEYLGKRLRNSSSSSRFGVLQNKWTISSITPLRYTVSISGSSNIKKPGRRKTPSAPFNSDSVASYAGLNDYFSDLILRGARPFCKKCGEGSQKQEHASILQRYSKPDMEGILCLAAPLSIQELSGTEVGLSDYLAAFNRDKFIDQNRLINVEGVKEVFSDKEVCKNQDGYVVLESASLPLIEESFERLLLAVKEAFDRGFSHLCVYRFLDRNHSSVSREKILPGYACLRCGRSLPSMSHETLLDCLTTIGNSKIPELGETNPDFSWEVGGINLDTIRLLSLKEASVWCQEVKKLEIDGLGPSVDKVNAVLEEYCRFGLEHVALNQSVNSLSRSEKIIWQLANCSIAGLRESVVAIKEGIGFLSERGKNRLFTYLEDLKVAGNSFFILSEREENSKSADYICLIEDQDRQCPISFLPPKEIDNKRSGLEPSEDKGLDEELTLNKGKSIGSSFCRVTGFNCATWQEGEISFPIESLICLKGDSGTGKTVLLRDILTPLIKGNLESPVRFSGVEADYFERVLFLEGYPARGPSFFLASEVGLMPLLADFFAGLEESRLKGLKKKDFMPSTSRFNCQVCKGVGWTKTIGEDLDICQRCGGKRFEPKIVGVKYHGKALPQILTLAATEAISFLCEEQQIINYLLLLDRVGLGERSLGDQVSGLSASERMGLEAVRALSSFLIPGLSKVRTKKKKRCLVLVDDFVSEAPSVCFRSIVSMFNELVDLGHTVIMVDNSGRLEKMSDYSIELGIELIDGGCGPIRRTYVKKESGSSIQ